MNFMKQISKIIEILGTDTTTQMQAALDDWIKDGYEFKQVFPLGTNTYAVFIKIISS